MRLLASLNSILAHHRRLGRSVDSLLIDGISDRDLISLLRNQGFDPPGDLIEMYGLYNGTAVMRGDSLDALHFFPGFYWLSIQDSLEILRRIRVDDRWDSSWLPIFANGGGDFYAVVARSNRQDFGCVVGFLLGESDHPVEFESLSKMLRVIEICFDRGVYYLTPDGYLEGDDQEQVTIAAALNPSLGFYRV